MNALLRLGRTYSGDWEIPLRNSGLSGYDSTPIGAVEQLRLKTHNFGFEVQISYRESANPSRTCRIILQDETSFISIS